MASLWLNLNNMDNKEFLEKKDVCKKVASESLMFSVISEDLPDFIKSIDQLEYSETVENLLDSVIKFFLQEKNILTNLALDKARK